MKKNSITKTSRKKDVKAMTLLGINVADEIQAEYDEALALLKVKHESEIAALIRFKKEEAIEILEELYSDIKFRGVVTWESLDIAGGYVFGNLEKCEFIHFISDGLKFTGNKISRLKSIRDLPKLSLRFVLQLIQYLQNKKNIKQ